MRDEWPAAIHHASRFTHHSSRFILTGFDSAWADRQPGAVASIEVDEDGRARFEAPRPATFADARALCLEVTGRARLHVLAIDQPTIVENETGARPVERALASLMVRLGGGIQPAFRRKVDLFGPDAPIWRLLGAIPHRQRPADLPGARAGAFVIEVFPSLALLELVPAFHARGRVAKHNPRRRDTFSPDDWRAICVGLAAFAEREAIAGLAAWADATAALPRVRKADQDGLDAAVCAAVAYAWWRHGPEAGLVLGDTTSGFIVTLATGDLLARLRQAAERAGLPCEPGV